MSDALATKSNLLNLLSHTGSTANLPQPFARDILLLETFIAGTSWRDLTAVYDTLNTGDELIMRREPDNAHDELAIKVVTRDDVHLGYIARAKNEIPARLMDAGKMLFVKVTSKKWENDWLKIDVQILMREL